MTDQLFALPVEIRRCKRNPSRIVVCSATGEVLLRTLDAGLREQLVAERFVRAMNEWAAADQKPNAAAALRLFGAQIGGLTMHKCMLAGPSHLVLGRIYAMAATDVSSSVKLHTAGEGHAKALIAAGKYDATSGWSFSAADGNELLGGENGQNWTGYGNMHLGEDTAAADKTKGRYKYPFGKGDKVYLSALNAIDGRATQEGATEVDAAAKRLKAAIKAKEDAKGGGKSWFTMKPAISAEAATNGNPVNAQILVYDEIGGWGMGAEDFHRALKALGDVKQLDMRINSPGGDSFAGIAIHNMLAAHPATKTAYVDGFAASAASLIAMAADKIVMPENTFMVVHNPYAMTVGPAAAHRSMADDLDRVSDAYAATYAKRSKQPVDAVKSLMAEDRLMGAPECKALGYCDELLPAKEMAATFDLAKVPEKYKGVAAIYKAAAAAPPAAADVAAAAAAAAAATSAAAAAAATAPAYGMGEIEETLQLCGLAKVSSYQANKFIGDKTPVAKVRETLAAMAASDADRLAIQRVDVTQADVDVTAAPHAGGAQPGVVKRDADPKVVAGKRALQDMIKAENGGRPPA
jgi:ATP-dependent protease ClpP protease subunit